jgi:hypothetical protein
MPDEKRKKEHSSDFGALKLKQKLENPLGRSS